MEKRIFTNEEWKEIEKMQEKAKQERKTTIKKRRLKLKKETCFMLGFITACIVMLLMNIAIDNYNDYLQRCDEEKGYTCNIFGR